MTEISENEHKELNLEDLPKFDEEMNINRMKREQRKIKDRFSKIKIWKEENAKKVNIEKKGKINVNGKNICEPCGFCILF